MVSIFSVHILLLVPIVTSYRVPRPTGCTRVFHFDFEHHVTRGVGGIWQGQVGEVKFTDGRAWFYGNGSLTYPFFSHNDLRPSFALTFKVKPSRSPTNGRVAIITNGVTPGSSTLTVFHNETCVGVKVTETAEPQVWTQSRSSSRDVELAVQYYKENERMKRSSDTVSRFPSYSGHEASKGSNSSSRIEDGFRNLVVDDVQQEDDGVKSNATSSPEKPEPDSVIAVRKLFRQNVPGYISRANKVVVDATERTSTSTAEPNSRSQDSDDSDSEDSTDPRTSTTTKSPLDVLSSYIVNPFYKWHSGEMFEQEQTTVSPLQTIAHTTTPSSVWFDNRRMSIPVSSFIVKPSRQRLPKNFPSIVSESSRMLDSSETSDTSSPQITDRVLIVPFNFRGLYDDDAEEVEIRLAQNNGVLSLQVGDSPIKTTKVGSTEHMKAPRSALRVGAGDGLLSYRGSFDEFSMFDCPPADFFSKAVPTARTSSFVWSPYFTSG